MLYKYKKIVIQIQKIIIQIQKKLLYKYNKKIIRYLKNEKYNVQSLFVHLTLTAVNFGPSLH